MQSARYLATVRRAIGCPGAAEHLGNLAVDGVGMRRQGRHNPLTGGRGGAEEVTEGKDSAARATHHLPLDDAADGRWVDPKRDGQLVASQSRVERRTVHDERPLASGEFVGNALQHSAASRDGEEQSISCSPVTGCPGPGIDGIRQCVPDLAHPRCGRFCHVCDRHGCRLWQRVDDVDRATARRPPGDRHEGADPLTQDLDHVEDGLLGGTGGRGDVCVPLLGNLCEPPLDHLGQQRRCGPRGDEAACLDANAVTGRSCRDSRWADQPEGRNGRGDLGGAEIGRFGHQAVVVESRDDRGEGRAQTGRHLQGRLPHQVLTPARLRFGLGQPTSGRTGPAGVACGCEPTGPAAMPRQSLEERVLTERPLDDRVELDGARGQQREIREHP